MTVDELYYHLLMPYMLPLTISIVITCIMLIRHVPASIPSKPLIFASSVSIVLAIIAFGAALTVKAGISHGVYSPNTSLIEILEKLPKTFKESKLPEDNSELSDKIIIYFRFGCHDCESIYQDLTLAMKDTPDVYYISTRSEQGKQLMEKYPVDETPSLVYIYPDGEKFAVFKLYVIGLDGNAKLNQEFLDRALEIRSKQQEEPAA